MTWSIERKEIETQRLLLRPFRAADAETVQRYAGLWDVARMTTRIPHPYPPGAAAEWICTHAAMEKENGESVFAITLDDEMVGATGLHRAEPKQDGPDTAEIGYWLAPAFWGRGLATETTRALLAHGFAQPKMSAVTSGHFTDNPASGRVLAKCGFRLSGEEQAWSVARRDYVTCKRLLLERADWQAGLELAS
ncbi:MAG TPA: N-acetyltransferase [Kiloniellaceae bacterium]|nr:N-acetyltransferase [Kiloniellaceae bacterium]HIP79657.1 N-acetyltransferase [Kiloniellaceae bacterium]